MSYANIIGRTGATGGQDKLTFADGLGDVFVKSLNTASITAYDPLLAPILVEGGLDLNLTGGIEGLTAVETDALNSRTQQLVGLSGNELGVLGNMSVLGDCDVSGSIVGLNTGSHIIFGSGIPLLPSPPGSVYIRSDGASGAEVIYVNHDGDPGSWTALS